MISKYEWYFPLHGNMAHALENPPTEQLLLFLGAWSVGPGLRSYLMRNSVMETRDSSMMR